MVERHAWGLDLTYSALADPTRRAILERLRAGESRVTDLARHFPLSLTAVSKHVRVLEGAGLVHREIRGREHLLTPNPDPLDDAGSWIAEYRAFWEHRADALAQHLEGHDDGGPAS